MLNKIDMYIRTIARKNKDGSEVLYVQLANNYCDKEAGQSRAKVLYNFGREEHLDTAALKRLINCISHYLGPEEALTNQENSLIKFVSSKPMGVTFFLDGLWHGLGIRGTVVALLKKETTVVLLSEPFLSWSPTGS
jgi:hypothetical protein